MFVFGYTSDLDEKVTQEFLSNYCAYQKLYKTIYIFIFVAESLERVRYLLCVFRSRVMTLKGKLQRKGTGRSLV